MVVLRNFHERQPGLERVHEREQDGLYESVHHRSLRDPYFSVRLQYWLGTIALTNHPADFLDRWLTNGSLHCSWMSERSCLQPAGA